MKAIDEFIPISETSILTILRERYGYTEEGYEDTRRARPRWPFPGTVELWVASAGGEEECVLARALNLSATGVGIMLDEALDVGQQLKIAIHQPEATLFGEAVVRHSRLTEHGSHAGLEFQL